MAEEELKERARALLDLCRRKKLKLGAAESCTGGLLAATLTEIPGSSDVFERGFVTYSNEAKETMLGVPPLTLKSHGDVSRETAEAMARGVLAHWARAGAPRQRLRGVDDVERTRRAVQVGEFVRVMRRTAQPRECVRLSSDCGLTLHRPRRPAVRTPRRSGGKRHRTSHP